MTRERQRQAKQERADMALGSWLNLHVVSDFTHVNLEMVKVNIMNRGHDVLGIVVARESSGAEVVCFISAQTPAGVYRALMGKLRVGKLRWKPNKAR